MNLKKKMFISKSKFNIYACDRRSKVWRKADEELKPENITLTVKHRNGSVMVWGSIAVDEVENFVRGTMDHIIYIAIL